MAQLQVIHLGIRGHVVALDAAMGAELWRTPLKGADFVNVVTLGGTVYAATKGEAFALDPATGTILWHNKLKGLGLGFVTFAEAAQAGPAAAKRRADQQAAAAAGAAAAASS